MKRALLGLASLCMAAMMGPAHACPPSMQLRFVVPFPPGGSCDILARNIALGLTERTGQKVVVENRTGGNGEVGTIAVARSAPDGCTLVFWGDGLLINQGMVENRAVDILKDFNAVTLVSRTAQTLVARADFRAKSLPALIELSKQPGADIRYATAGIGTPGHLVIELLNAKSGGKLRHVPYRGGAPALTDLLGGQIELVSTGLPALIGQIQAGALIALAVSPETRSPALPDVPTMAEVAPGVFFDTWYGFLAPASTPEPVRAKLHGDIAAVMRDPAISTKLVQQGFEIVDLGPAELGRMMQQDLPRLMEIVTIAGLKKQ